MVANAVSAPPPRWRRFHQRARIPFPPELLARRLAQQGSRRFALAGRAAPLPGSCFNEGCPEATAAGAAPQHHRPLRPAPSPAAAQAMDAALQHRQRLCLELGVPQQALRAMAEAEPHLLHFAPEVLQLTLQALAARAQLRADDIQRLAAAQPRILTQPDHLKLWLQALQASCLPLRTPHILSRRCTHRISCRAALNNIIEAWPGLRRCVAGSAGHHACHCSAAGIAVPAPAGSPGAGGG